MRDAYSIEAARAPFTADVAARVLRNARQSSLLTTQ